MASGQDAQHSSGPESKVYGANMGPTWGRQDPGGSHVGPMNLAIWGIAVLSVGFWSLKFAAGIQHMKQQLARNEK